MSGDLAGPVAGLRSLMMQALHPLAMAGVDQHSGWRQDPVGRLAATSAYVSTVSFGAGAASEQAAARVRRIHTGVAGGEQVTGRPYEASDRVLVLWVQAALVDSDIAVRQLIGTPLSPEDADRYVAEMVVAAELVGVPADVVPSSVAELDRYISSVRPELRCTPAARESMAYLLDPPGLDEDIAESWQDIRDGAIAPLPDWAREGGGGGALGVGRGSGALGVRRGLGALKPGARGGARYAGSAPRLFAAAGENRQRLRNDLALQTAEDVATTLGAMKGVLMKLGQMASYVDDGLSPAVRRTLSRLQDSVPPMSADLAARVVREELGDPPERGVARWDPEPIAAASIWRVAQAITLH